MTKFKHSVRFGNERWEIRITPDLNDGATADLFTYREGVGPGPLINLPTEYLIDLAHAIIASTYEGP